MSEDGDMWREIKEAKKEKRWANERSSLRILEESGKSMRVELLSPTSAHYRVNEYDFWPTTGKFYNQKTGEKGRGVFNLLKRI